MSKKDKQFWESASLNNSTFNYYYNRLTELAISRFEWKNLPDSVDPRFLELCLYGEGHCIYFNDDVLGNLALRCIIAPPLNVYNIPTKRRAIANNGYQKDLSIKNSVIIYNNLIRTVPKVDITLFAKRLYNLDRIIDVNANAQKTPILIKATQQQELTLRNLYMKYEGNMPVVFADSAMTDDPLTVLKTDAPYISDKIYMLKTQIWNEALTYLGINNINLLKKERLLSGEVTRNSGATNASRNSSLEARQIACEKINKMFNTNISVEFKTDITILDENNFDNMNEKEGTENE